MPWSEQAEATLKVLTDAQKKMWDSWLELIRTASAPSPFSSAAFDQWRELATHGRQTWAAESAQFTKDLAKHLLGVQDAVIRFMDLSASAWKALAPKVESGEDWQAVLRSYTDQLRQQLLQFPEGMAMAVQDTGELWRMYLEEWQKLGVPWAESLRRAPSHFARTARGEGPALVELTALWWDAYERTFGRLLEAPSLGYTREITEDLVKGFSAWADYRRASFDYQIIVTDAWAQSFEQFMRKLVSLAEKGDTVKSVRKLLYVWIEVIDDVFARVFHSTEYLRIQGRLINTTMAYRLCEREIVETWLKTTPIPSKRELDEAYRRIYELRKEVKQLRKDLDEAKVDLAALTNR